MANVRRQLQRRATRLAKDFGLGYRVPRAYRQAASSPVDPRKALFLEASLPVLPEAFKVMFARMSADPAFDVEFVSLGKNRVSASAYLRNCEEFARKAATARVVFLCDASDVVSAFPLRPETNVVQLWHACGAFKKWGMSTADLSFGLNREDTLRHPGYENLSLVTVSSPEVRWAYIEAMNLVGRDEIVQPTGVSRTDLFFDERFLRQASSHVLEEVPAAVGKRVVLHAPTLRGKLAHARAPEMPDLLALRRAVGDSCVVLVKHHPAVRDVPPIPSACEGFAFDVTRSLPIDELLAASDVLVTDYSSVVFEFSLFVRPMVFFAPDLDEYADARSFYYDYDEMTPGPVVKTTGELADFLQDVDGRSDLREVAAFRDRFMSACDGHATDRILSWI